MKNWIIATAAAATLFASAGAASAQGMNSESNSGWNSGYSQRGPMMDRNVSMPTYGERRMAPSYGYSRPGNTGSTYDSNAFKSQEVWPQSPPTGS